MKLRIYRSIKQNLITQGFGAKNTSPKVKDLYASLGLDGHNGWDFLLQNGDPIYFDCSCEGKVIETHIDKSGGLGVVIITENESGIYKHRYWHLKNFYVKPGQIVHTGDLLGWGDNSGLSNGPHLHRDIKKLSSWDGGSGYVIENYNNGYKGAISMDGFFENIFVLDKMKYLEKKKALLQRITEALAKVIELYKKQRNL